MGHASYGNHSGADGGRPDEREAALTPQKEGAGKPPASGPHGDDKLTNPDATPGTGALPTPGGSDATDSTSS